VAITIVERTFLTIGQNGICFAALLEFFFRVRIVRIAVGMVLQGQLAVGALDLLLAGATLDAQDFVIISF